MIWPLSLPMTIYLAVLALAVVIAVLWILSYLRLSHRMQVRMLRRRERLIPLPTSSPLEHPNDEALERGLESIHAQFSVTRKVAIPIVLVLAALLGALPFASQLPAAILTLFATAITVLLGLAARPVVENAISGLVISNSKLISIGDTIRIEGHYGTVEDITTTHCTIKLWDWRRLVVPNQEMLRTRYLSYSLFDRFLWTRAELWVSPEADLELVRRLAVEAARESPHFAGHEQPQMWVMEVDKDAIKIWIAAWADTPSDGWMLAADIREGMLARMHAHGLATHGFRVLTPAGAGTAEESEIGARPGPGARAAAPAGDGDAPPPAHSPSSGSTP